MNADLTAKCAYLFDNLRKKGITLIEMSFSGSGDDGQLEWENVFSKNDNDDWDGSWDEPTIFDYGNVKMTLGQLVEEITENVIDFYDIDYQNNEGNNGGVAFNVETGRISTTYQIYTIKEESLYI